MSRSNEEILQEVAGDTVPKAFLRTLATYPDMKLFGWLEGEERHEWSTAEFADLVAKAAAGLAALGIKRGDRVVIMMRNIPQFHVVDLAALFLGATPVSIYNSSSSDQVAYLAGHSAAKVAVLEDDGFAQRFAEVASELPALTATVQLNGAADGNIGWDEFMSHQPLVLADHVDTAQPEDLATIIYTSGTTGNPKGVMLDHVNVMWTASSLVETFPFSVDELVGMRLVSYLPMAHIAERVTSHYSALIFGYCITCCPEASQIATYAREVKPNIMFGVPRVWEKVHAGVSAALAADPEKQQQVADAVAAATPIVEKMDWGAATQEEIDTWNFLDAVAFSTLRGLIGLDELKLAITGAAPIPPELINWFRAIGVPLCEIYGLSETSGPLTFATSKIKAGSVGPAIPGGTVRIADDGEVLYAGANVFKGYLNEPEKTAEALDADGWFHTGDIGELDEDGYLRIVDRKKELIITAGGKNISPANLEAALKTIPLVGQACAIGDQRPFVSALVVLDADVAAAWARQNGVDGSLADLAANPQVRAEIEEGLERAMAGFNNAERVKKITILAEEWMPDSDMLTPTSKLKRRGIHAHFADQIEAMYNR